LISVSEKGCFFSPHIRISDWIDLGGGAAAIDIPGSWDSTPSKCLSISGNSAIDLKVANCNLYVYTHIYTYSTEKPENMLTGLVIKSLYIYIYIYIYTAKHNN